jgi:protein tyrosine/serine phosphatase
MSAAMRQTPESSPAAGAERLLPLAGIRNFRDYGGYRAGRSALRRGVLFRSGQHNGASDSDLEAVDRIGLALVVDLRGASERAAAPCRRGPGFAARIVSVDDETAGLAPHVAAARAAGADPRSAMAEAYRGLPFRPTLTTILGAYFEALAETDGPSLVHCLAGKDRTGFAVALLHHLLGVHHDDLVADYLLSNQAGLAATRTGAAARRLFGVEIGEDAVRELMGVREEYLDAAFAAVRETHGSIESYCRDRLGVDTPRRDALAARFIA